MKYRSCKDCPQYDKCVATANLAIKRKRCEFADNSRNKKPLTNFDRIKAMSVEEMAELLLDGCRGSDCNEQPLNEYGSVNCFKCRKSWLESEVQGE